MFSRVEAQLNYSRWIAKLMTLLRLTGPTLGLFRVGANNWRISSRTLPEHVVIFAICFIDYK